MRRNVELGEVADTAMFLVGQGSRGMTGEVLMVAHMSAESLRLSIETGEAWYWSRSRGRLWRKGGESGHVQKVRALRLDCDDDALLLEVEQVGGIACHTGRQSCFFQRYEPAHGGSWVAIDPVLRDPSEIYRP